MKHQLEEQTQFFVDHIPMFWKHRKAILEAPRFWAVETPNGFCQLDHNLKPEYLGQVLELWENEPTFTPPCHCGATALVYAFDGNIFSGKYTAKARCPVCEKLLQAKIVQGEGVLVEAFNRHIRLYTDRAEAVTPEKLVACLQSSSRFGKRKRMKERVKQQEMWQIKEAAFHSDLSFLLMYALLFLRNRELILADPRFYNTLIPQGAFSQCRQNPTIGDLLELWETDDRFSTPCKCGGKGLICCCYFPRSFAEYRHGGYFPIMSAHCTTCDSIFDLPFDVRKEAHLEFALAPHPIEENPVTIKELVSILEMKRE
jgi:hypothetical protein